MFENLFTSPPPGEIVKIEVPELEETIYLRSMTSAYHDRAVWRFREAENNPDKRAGMSAFVVAGCLCDHEGGRKTLTEAELKSLEELDCGILERLCEHAARLSGLAKDAVEEAEKNSPQSVDSG